MRFISLSRIKEDGFIYSAPFIEFHWLRRVYQIGRETKLYIQPGPNPTQYKKEIEEDGKKKI